MSWYTKNNQELEKQLETNLTDGLTQQQVDDRLKKDGYNELAKVKQLHWIFIFLKALFEPLSVVLMMAASVSFVISIINKHIEYIEIIVIFAIVILNASINCFQEIKARKSIEALAKLTEPKAVVIREKQQIEILARNLVVGDIVVLEVGKYVPADIRLIEAQRLLTDESSLTGETINVNKTSNVIAKENLLLADQLNMVFMSTFITSGRAVGVVVTQAKNSEIGKIAKSISENKGSLTVLQVRMRNLTKWLTILAVFISALIFAVLFFTNKENGLLANHLLIAITLAIAVIPESLTIIISITLAISVGKMANKNVIVKKLSSVETLGSVSVICTDKTGTLTQNKMQIEHYFYNNSLHAQDNIALFDLNQDNYFLSSLALCNDAVNSNNERIGDHTEIALVDWLMKFNLKETQLRIKFNRIDEIPFDSDRKLMTTVNQINGQQIVFTKGAIDNLLKICTAINIEGKKVEINENMLQNILNQAHELSFKSLRILGFAYKHKHNNNLEEDLTFLGFVAMKDHLREEAKLAVEQAKKANIRVIMITGDHKITAFAIAKELGLVQNDEQVLSGEELNLISDQKLNEIIDNINVFARVNPEHKQRIVNCLQKKKNIVAMTGDGVNDAPSLSKADIGLAIGITGTDVAKQASDIILADDNFSTIVTGIDEGRNIYRKILRCVTFVLSANLAEVLAIFMIVAISNTMILKPINVLWFNLIVESILAIPIAFDINDQSLMFDKPRNRKESIFKLILIPTITIALILGLTVIATFYTIKTLYNNEIAATSAFLVLINAPIFYITTIRLSKSNLSKPFNKISFALLLAMIISLILNAMVLFIPYVNSQICKLTVLKWKAILIGYAFALLPFVLIISYKTMFYLIKMRKVSKIII